MHLRTDWEGFLEELDARWPQGTTIYIANDGGPFLMTAYDPNQKVVISTKVIRTRQSIEQELGDRGHRLQRGMWSSSAASLNLEDLVIAAVAYVSAERRPGLWVDAFTVRPTVSEVIDKLVGELCEEGSIEIADPEIFVKVGKPNVVILGSEEIQTYMERNAMALAERELVGDSPAGEEATED